jgi:hypothetical protein
MNKMVNLTVLLDGEASVAEARGGTFSNIGELSATGSAKKHPKDTSEPEVGFNLAVARALRALADQYEKRAEQAQHFANFPQRWAISQSPGTITSNNPNPNFFTVNQEV